MSAFKNCLQKPFLSSYLSLQQVRFYARWSHRRPVRVYTPEEYEAAQKQNNVKKCSSETTNILPLPSIEENNCETVERVVRAANERTEGAETEKLEVEDFGFEKITNPKTCNLRKPVHKKEVPKVDMLETIIDGNGNFVYTKMQNKDTRITYV